MGKLKKILQGIPKWKFTSHLFFPFLFINAKTIIMITEGIKAIREPSVYNIA